VLPVELDDRCELRLIQESDAAELAAVVDANRTHLSRWLPWAAENTVDDTRDHIRRARDQAERDDGLQAVIVCDGRIVGGAGYHRIDRANHSTSIGYWLAEDAQGRGIMTRAVGAMVTIAFSDWQLNRVEIRCAPENARSRAIPERLGFREEGTLRQAERIGDRYLDSVVYSMLASDWSLEQ
jgi:ribosomal-protein-serine acetyltransferase